MTPNPGRCPPEAMGRKVRVHLANGQVRGPWPASGAQGVCWDRRGHPFDIAEYEVVA